MTLHDRLAVWLDLLARCGKKGTRKRVHALRVATLRLQAELERDVSELPRASHQAQAMLRFGKQAEKLRQALGPVREIDVWIGKLDGLEASLNKPGEYVPRAMQECLRGIERLRDRLKRDRRTAGKTLAAEIQKKSDRFAKVAEGLEAVPVDERIDDTRGIAHELVEHFERVRAEFPVLHEANLHDFRKRVKTVRYLAELHAGADRECARIATQMKKLQGAIGEWHDWQALAAETRREHHAWSKPLGELLESVSKETFATALETAYAVMARMQEQAAKVTGLVEKAPVQSEPGLPVETSRKLA